MKIKFVVDSKSKSLDENYLNYIYSVLNYFYDNFYSSILTDSDVILQCSDDRVLKLVLPSIDTAFARKDLYRFLSLGLQTLRKTVADNPPHDAVLELIFDCRYVNPNFMKSFELDQDDADDIVFACDIESALFRIFSRRFVQLEKVE